MKNNKPQNIKIIKNEEKPETPELLASSILNISKAFSALVSSGLTHRGIETLLKGMPGMNEVSVKDIRLVLENLPRIGSYYIRK